MKRLTVCVLLTAVLLWGCNFMQGDYVSVTPHENDSTIQKNEVVSVSNYQQLRQALITLVESGTESSLLSVAKFDSEKLPDAMGKAIHYVTTQHPIGAYAVEKVEWELGSTGGGDAVAVEITYRRSKGEIQRIRQLRTTVDALPLIYSALDQCGTGTVFYIEQYKNMDLTQSVQDYAMEHPELVMELPQVTEILYPDSGSSRLVELKFTYQTSREALKAMQSYVQPVFASARLYVSGDTETHIKYAQLYAFLMERYDYQQETSITPAYSLLRHGVGDSRAFASVYAAMCRQAGLECQIVTGTREGEAHFWNIICIDGLYYHCDLFPSDSFSAKTDEEMQGYVWDYSAYPTCAGVPTA